MKKLPAPAQTVDALPGRLHVDAAIIGAVVGVVISLGFGALGVTGLVASPIVGALLGAARGATGGAEDDT